MDEPMRDGQSSFQRDFGLKRDGIMHPGGKTQTRLDALVAPLIQVAATRLAEAPPATTTTAPATSPSSKGEAAQTPEEQDHEQPNCATLWSRIEATREELEQIESDIALLETDPLESDRNMTWRYAELLEEYGGYSTAPPETPLSILKIPDVSKPGAGVDGPASTSGIKRGKGLTGLAGSVDKILRTNPEQVAEARRLALSELRQIERELNERFALLKKAFSRAGCRPPHH